MGSASDPIFVKVSTHTQAADNTTRNDVFYMTANLNAYGAQLANNIATPVYNYVLTELSPSFGWPGPAAPGPNAPQYSTPVDSSLVGTYGFSPGVQMTLRAQVGVGLEPLATPNRYHIAKYDTFTLATPPIANLTVTGQMIYNWIDGILQKLNYQNLYTGAPYTNG